MQRVLEPVWTKPEMERVAANIYKWMVQSLEKDSVAEHSVLGVG